MQDNIESTEAKKQLPAWMMSVGAHVVLLFALSLLSTTTGNALPTDEPVRPVGIVLARSSSETNREYFDESAEEALKDSQSAASKGEQTPLEVTAASTLPDSPVLSEFALPKNSDLPIAGATSVDTPRLTVSNARPKFPGVDDSEIIADEQARFQAANARGPTTTLGIFGSKEATGGSFVFLIDRSQSMGGGGLGVLQDAELELVRVLKRLEPEHRFQVVVYHNKTVYMSNRKLLAATDANKALVPDFLGSKAAFGSTLHGDAIMSVLSLEPDVIFLLTDGGEPKLKDHEIRSIAKFAKSRTAIHCLHFGSGPVRDADNFLSRLAAATGGEYGYVDVNQRRN